MPTVRKFTTEQQKCSGCGYRVTNHYVIEKSQEAAKAHFTEYDGGLCGDCLLETLIDAEAVIHFDAS
jgi:hypothetical protein